MAAAPVSDADGEQPAPRAGSLTEWLRRRPDRQLGRLLRLRPDLTLPAAPDIAALASRLGVRTSTQRCIDGLDAFTLHVLEELVLAAGADDTVADGLPPEQLPALEALFDRALVWGDPDLVHLTPTVRDAVGPHPGGLGRPAARLFALAADAQLAPALKHLGLEPAAQPAAGKAVAARLADPDGVEAALRELDEDERAVLQRLSAGSPVGNVRNEPAATELSAARRLVNRGLLAPIDTQRVELPREVGLALRDHTSPTDAEPPQMKVVEREPAELDRLGTTAVLEFLRLADALAESWTAHPPAVLRSGGLGVRDLKRSAREIGVDDATAAVVAETMYAASLVNSTNGHQPTFLPTDDYDRWCERPTAQRWLVLAQAWLTMTRQPSLAGERDERDRVITALGPDAERGTVPGLRRQLLGLLTGVTPGDSPADRDEVRQLFTWHQPRRAGGQRYLVGAILAEADLLGVTAAGGLTGYTRTLLAGSPAAAEHALEHALPVPVDHFLVQPDLTVVVPGPPEQALGVELGLIADLESTGGASVYRITERSVRRALDAGRSGETLAAFVTAHSRTPIPQALQYLIDDAARRHGVLRTGAAGAYLRCDDESLLTRVLAERAVAGLNLRMIAPTVVISEAPVTRVLEQLREAGFAPAAESPDGTLITIGLETPRAPSRPPSRAMSVRGVADTDAQVAELVRRLRSGDALAGMDSKVHPIAREIPGVTSAATMELLRDAVREERMVWFGCAEADGSTTAHTMQPISLAAGTLRGYESGRTGLAAYPVHRITSIRVLDEETDPPSE